MANVLIKVRVFQGTCKVQCFRMSSDQGYKPAQNAYSYAFIKVKMLNRTWKRQLGIFELIKNRPTNAIQISLCVHV